MVGRESRSGVKAMKGLRAHLDQALLDEVMIVDLHIDLTDRMTINPRQIDRLRDLAKGPGTASMKRTCLPLVNPVLIVPARHPTTSILDISHRSKLQST